MSSVGERLLEPVDAESLELARELHARSSKSQRGVRSPGMRQPWFASTITSSSGTLRPHGLDHGQVDAPIVRVEADLRGAHARVAQCPAAAHALVRIDELAARCVRADSAPLAAEQLPQRLVPCAPDEIPDGDLDDPVAPVMEVDGLDDPVDGVGVGYVDSDEQALEQLAIRNRIAARVALDAVVGADDHDRRVLVGARLGVPGAARNGGSSG